MNQFSLVVYVQRHSAIGLFLHQITAWEKENQYALFLRSVFCDSVCLLNHCLLPCFCFLGVCSLLQRYAFWLHSEILVSLKLFHNIRLLNEVRHNFLLLFGIRFTELSVVFKKIPLSLNCCFYVHAAELWLSFWSEVHYNSLYELRGSFFVWVNSVWWSGLPNWERGVC